MFLRSLKKTIIFSVAAIFCYGLFVSCENPFTSNLGSKVDIEPPTITVISPTSGDFLKGAVTFTGEATAYRDLRRSNGEYSDAIQVMIYDQDNDTRDYLSWTTIGGNITAHPTKEKTWVWTYDLDTTGFKDTGFLKMKFRVYDESADANRKPTETVQLVYIVKNRPSSVKIGTPDHSYLDSPESELLPWSLITNDNEISGTILDRRGIKPGYPMIKFWPEDLVGGEPAGNHPEWGWASLYLTAPELDDPKAGVGHYADRDNMAVVTTSSFSFKLWKYWIEPETRQIRYILDSSGDPEPQAPGKRYRFRIKTSDTYFNTANGTPEEKAVYRFPRAPEEDEQEAIGYYPDITALDGNEEQWDRSGPSYVVMVKSSGVPPQISLNNHDKTDAELEAMPHIYITPTSFDKIAVRESGLADFRLQVMVFHPDGIDHATLQYEYTSGGTRGLGYLPWDNSFGTGYTTTNLGDSGTADGYVNGTSLATKAEEGHRGWRKDGEGEDTVYFRYTSDGANDIFKANAKYNLTVSAFSKGEKLNGKELYVLVLDDTSPRLSIEAVRGASNNPNAPGTMLVEDGKSVGGFLFATQSYEVNGNIQVSLVDGPSSDWSIKWVVEASAPSIDDDATMLGKLWKYRKEPNAVNYSFYGAIAEGRQSGIVKEPATSGLEPDMRYNLKFNTWNGPEAGPNAWNNTDLWLYIIAENEVKNLGFVIQKLHVDDSKDKPTLLTSDNFISTTTTLNIGTETTPNNITIKRVEDLYYYLGTPPTGITSNTERKNVLDNGGIDLTFNDDDGISVPSAATPAANITITVTDLNASPNVTRTLSNAQLREFLSYNRYLIDNNNREWRGVLSQRIMADALGLNQSVAAETRKLPDGYYRLNVSFSDNLAAKVAIVRNPPLTPAPAHDTPTAATGDAQVYFFAVQSNNPAITIDPLASPVLNSGQATGITITGKATSGVKIQRLNVTLTPTLTTPPASPLTLYRNTTYGTAAVVAEFGDTERDANGNYVYYWRIQNLNLTATTSTSTSRTFDFTAWDGMRNTRNETLKLEIDTVAPLLTLDLFNFGRDLDKGVNGKVPIEIGVWDLGGIKVTPVLDPNADPDVDRDTSKDLIWLKWWVVRDNVVPTGWDFEPTNGAHGQFTQGDDLGGAKYWAVFDTTTEAFTDPAFTGTERYHLYAMAEDEAGNKSGPLRLPATNPLVFTINQDGDLPVLDTSTLSPVNNDKVSNAGGNELTIKGEISDDDGFDEAKADTYVQIRFPVGLPSGEPATVGNTLDFGTAENGWIDVPARLEAGIIKFEYITKVHSYFTNLSTGLPIEGYKYYQLRISDEDVPGGDDGDYYLERTPHGKNPDGDPTIGKVFRTYPVVDAANPTSRNYYYFNLDNGAPQVLFAKYDPDSTHPGYNTAGQGARPAYNKLNLLVADLAGMEIQEGNELNKVEFSYGNVVKGDLVTLNYIGAKVGDRYPVNIPPAVLSNTTNGWLKDVPFTGLEADEGMDTIYIYARDAAGNEKTFEWTFYIDNVGPDISFMNVDDNAGIFLLEKDMRIVQGRSGTTYLKGSFEDNLSNIAAGYRYRFETDADFTNVTYGENGVLDLREGRRAGWEIVVPSTLPDGPHTLYIEAFDTGDNYSAQKYSGEVKTVNGTNVPAPANAGIKFVLDAKEPVLSESEKMLIDVTGTKENPADYNRVFSAAYADAVANTRVFTLSGLVYDRYLSNLTIGFQAQLGSSAVRTITLTNIDTWDGTGSYSTTGMETTGATSALTDRLRVRRLTPTEKTANTYAPHVFNDDTSDTASKDSPYLYVWELDVNASDLAAIRSQFAGNDNTIRQITVTAQDRAMHNSDVRSWRFYMDSNSPVVSFTNAVTASTYSHYKGTGDTAWFTSADPPLPSRIDVINNNFALEGVARDGTGIKEIKYLVSRSNSGLGDDWTYYTAANGTGPWTSTTRPAETAWRVMYQQSGTSSDTTAYPTLNNSMLGTANGYPANLSDGLYRLELVVTDFSRAATAALAGNPVRPIVQFFIDRNEPELTLKGEPQDFYQTAKLDFNFKAEDYATKVTVGTNTTVTAGNGIVGFAEAELRVYGTTTKVSTVNVVTTVTPTNPASATEVNVNVKITPVNPATPPLDGRYTLVLTVRDRTGKDAVIGNTFDFYLDNKKPTVGIIPAGNNATSGNGDAITGRVLLQGSFNKATSDSPVRRVAFQLAQFVGTTTATTPTPITPDENDPTVPAVGNLTDTDLKTNNWYFDSNGVGDNPRFSTGTGDSLKVYWQINPGLSSANVLIPNTRDFLQTIGTRRYMGTAQTVTSTGATIKFDGVDITPNTETVHKLRVYFLAIDEADNYKIETVDYWVYPEGDKPKASINIPNATMNLFSGTFRISGTAIDNDYVKRVYFRVYVDNATTPFTRLVVPNWKDDWTVGTGYQTAQTLTDITGVSYGGGWYIANGGGRRNPNWWAMINADGELDPTGVSTEIKIEVMAEDSIWNDFADGGNGAWETGKGLYTSTTFNATKPLENAGAKVVKDAPSYSAEIVKQGASDTSFADWSSALTTNVSGRASYALTVQAVTTIGEIRWTRPNGAIVNLLDKPLSGTPGYATHYNTGTGSETYAGDLAAMGTDDTGTGPGIVVKAVPIPPTSSDYADAYKVVVDINSFILASGAFGKDKSGRYELTISATDSSNPVPLSSQTTAQIPIDNIPPQALYTHSSRVAGSSASFGGVAGDTGTISGLSRVVMWFSVNGVSVVWNDKGKSALLPGTNPPGSDGFQGLNTAPTGIINIETMPSTVKFPVEPSYGADAENFSCVVIDQNDPQGNERHHGHQVSMGFANTGAGALPRSWYAVLNSMNMESGIKTVHYVVYDTAGNATYYNQRIMVMNNIPQIKEITLATDIRGDKTFTPALNANAAINTPLDNTNSALGRIRKAYGSGDGAFVSVENDIASGISAKIPIDTTSPNTYGVVYDNEFSVRNNLLAIKIETRASSTYERKYRFEYVSNAKLISGYGDDANQIRNASTGIRAGRVYIINDPGSATNRFPWGGLGAQGDTFGKGLAFLALEDGSNLDLTADVNYGTPSVWELNSRHYRGTDNTRTLPTNLNLGDVVYATGGATSTSAEFVYAGASAFSGTGSFTTSGNINTTGGSTISTGTGTNNANETIVDFVPGTDLLSDGRPENYLGTSTRPVAGTARHPLQAHSLFIVRVFDTVAGAEELFGDFALLSIRVNNNDKTPPYSQLYDLNPKTEGQENTQSQMQALSPVSMGNNRAKGGLFNTGTVLKVAKSGHIEPRGNDAATPTSLTSFEMGGAATAQVQTLTKPVAQVSSFTYDTVSGEVIVRGYAEDDQRVGSVALQIWAEANTGTTPLTTITILDYASRTNNPNPGGTNPNPNALIGPPTAVIGRVQFTETIDLNRHRVEWAYLWNTENYPGGTNVTGNFNIRAVVGNANSTPANNARITRSDIPATGNTRNIYDYYNPSFPSALSQASSGNFYRYNDIRVNIRPYITGFLRNQAAFSHNTRSRQGRYMFAQGETALITGFNLRNITGGSDDTVVTLAGTTATQSSPTAAQGGEFGLPTTSAPNPQRYRRIVIAETQTTGHGMVTLTVNGNYAVNTGDARLITDAGTNPRPTRIQPWNIEYNPAVDGSELWDDFTMIHIWRSNGTATGYDQGTFKVANLMNVMDPAMSINPTTGVLYASHNESGNGANVATGGAGSSAVSSNAANTTARIITAAFCDPIRHSDVFVSDAGTIWNAYSIIGKQGGATTWTGFGGVYVTGISAIGNNNAPTWAGGANFNLSVGTGNTNQYLVESTFYNASSTGPGTQATPPSTDQFHNPHIVVDATGGNNNIHVSYYDEKDKSLKYRYNRQGSPGTAPGGTASGNDNVQTPFAWTNLDGGFDADDTRAYNANNYAGGWRTTPISGFVDNIAANGRVVNYATRNATGATLINAGKHNSIALTSQGYPIIAYFDETNQQLKMAVSNNTVPVAATYWRIVESNTIFATATHRQYQFGTGEFVSLKIDTVGRGGNAANTFHIAALNSTSKNLVYIKGVLPANPVTGTITISSVQVVDSVGSVGSWCALSLDANGNPWIAYQDESYRGSRDGVKVAYLNTTRFTKGGTGTTFVGQDTDVFGTGISGWEAMHVPTQFRVENARLGMERFPTVRNPGASKGTGNGLQTFAAVGYLGEDRYRVAYYVE